MNSINWILKYKKPFIGKIDNSVLDNYGNNYDYYLNIINSKISSYLFFNLKINIKKLIINAKKLSFEFKENPIIIIPNKFKNLQSIKIINFPFAFVYIDNLPNIKHIECKNCKLNIKNCDNIDYVKCHMCNTFVKCNIDYLYVSNFNFNNYLFIVNNLFINCINNEFGNININYNFKQLNIYNAKKKNIFINSNINNLNIVNANNINCNNLSINNIFVKNINQLNNVCSNIIHVKKCKMFNNVHCNNIIFD